MGEFSAYFVFQVGFFLLTPGILAPVSFFVERQGRLFALPGTVTLSVFNFLYQGNGDDILLHLADIDELDTL